MKAAQISLLTPQIDLSHEMRNRPKHMEEWSSRYRVLTYSTILLCLIVLRYSEYLRSTAASRHPFSLIAVSSSRKFKWLWPFLSLGSAVSHCGKYMLWCLNAKVYFFKQTKCRFEHKFQLKYPPCWYGSLPIRFPIRTHWNLCSNSHFVCLKKTLIMFTFG